MSAGSIISIFGSNVGSSLAASRMLFAFAENGDIPPFFGPITSGHCAPAAAIWFSTAVTLVLAITGSFTVIAGVSALARRVTLRQRFGSDAGIAEFQISTRRVRASVRKCYPRLRNCHLPGDPCGSNERPTQGGNIGACYRRSLVSVQCLEARADGPSRGKKLKEPW